MVWSKYPIKVTGHLSKLKDFILAEKLFSLKLNEGSNTRRKKRVLVDTMEVYGHR